MNYCAVSLCTGLVLSDDIEPMISDFAYCDRFYRSVVCLSACLSASATCHVRLLWPKGTETISTRFLLHTTVPCMSEIMLKFGIGQPLLP